MKKPRFFSTTIAGRIGAFLIALLVFVGLPCSGYAQQPSEIIGTVQDATNGSPLPGATILVKGTTSGSVTDLNGNFTIRASQGDVLVFSSMGYLSEEVEITVQTVLNITLAPDILGLDEVVVIGYGVQRKKLNTGANLNVSGDAIQAVNPNSPMDALKGVSAGVSITQVSGRPGEGARITIRGQGTIGNANPLYIVDGVEVGSINNLSPSDIESIDVLKDAASAAIYGSRAANGVILVTTRKGRRDTRTQVTYDGYYGVQNIYKKPDLLNAQQYIEIQEKQAGRAIDFTRQLRPANVNPDSAGLSQALWDSIQGGWTGTNWFEEVYVPNAPVQSHAVNITGGSKYSLFSMGASYFGQQGIIGKDANSKYERINLRLNSEHTLLERNGRNAIVVGQNLSYTNHQNPTIRTGNVYWNDFRGVLIANPLLPMYDQLNPDQYHYALSWNDRDINPYASMRINSEHSSNNNNTVVGNVYLELQPVTNLTLRSSYGINNWSGSSRQWLPVFALGAGSGQYRDRDQVTQSMYTGYTWTFTNTASYNLMSDLHSLNFLVGNEVTRNNRSLSMSGSNQNSIFNDPEFGYLDNVPLVDLGSISINGRDDYGWAMNSYFGRLTYDFRETYLLTVVMRADGSSRFARGNRWGYFPSISAGWILTNEQFLAGTSSWLNFLRLRGSWGQNGNERIMDFQYLSSITFEGYEYFFGPNKGISTVGAYPARVPNPNVTWETSEQINVGADIFLLSNRLQFVVDVYQKDTEDWLVLAPSLATDGTNPPFINGGTVSNRGIELVSRWNDRVGEFNYGLTVSAAYNKNNVTQVNTANGLIIGERNALANNTSYISRVEEGYPIGYFWGVQTDGVLQNAAEVDAWRKPTDGSLYFSNQAPGDLRFVDQNGDGSINDNDKVMLGKPQPDYVLGFQFNSDFRGAYLQLSAYANLGHQIARSYRNFLEAGGKDNYTTEVYDFWDGEGTSNRFPAIYSAPRNRQIISDIYIWDGDFLRISNLTIGYDLKHLIKALPVQSMKVYFSSNNLLTLTKYPGLDPEVGYGQEDGQRRSTWASGIDLGLYPSARSFNGGISITF